MLKACFNRPMDKSKAIELLGGTVAAAASKVGVSPQAVTAWPDPLPPRIADRVIAAVAREHLPPELLAQIDAANATPDAPAPPPAAQPEPSHAG